MRRSGAAGNTRPPPTQRRPVARSPGLPEPRTLLLTRPEAQSRAFAAALEAALPGRFQAIVAPLIEIVPVDAAIDLAGAQGLLFTSANGVEQFAARWDSRDLPAFCVGGMTAEAAVQAGFNARSSDGDVAALAALVAAAHRPGAGDFLHPRGRHAAGDLTGRLAGVGVPARAAEVYDQMPRPLSAEARAQLARGEVDAVAVFSPRTAMLFAAEVRAGGWDLSCVAAVSLAASADAALDGLGLGRRRVAAVPTREGMIAAFAAL